MGMTGYVVFGGFRNLIGIALLSVLVWAGMSVTPALLIVLSIDFAFYVVQVRLFVGAVGLSATAGLYLFVFFANRLLLWLLYERLGAPIYAAQIISILLLVLGSYVFLKKWRIALPARKL
jgi:hypothetical protein